MLLAANPYQTVSRRGSEGRLVLLPGHTVTSFTSHIHPPKELIQTQDRYLLGRNYLILRSQKLKNEKNFNGNILQDKYWHDVEMFVGLDQPCEGQFLRWNIIFKWITTFSVTSWEKGQILRSFRDMLRHWRNLSSFFRDTLRPRHLKNV